MFLVLLLSLGSAFCAALSTVLKHQSADAMPAGGDPQSRSGPVGFVLAMVTNPLWLFGLIGDVGAIGFQILALRHGDLAFVQPILTTSLVVALIGNHVAQRTPLSAVEAAYSVGLVGGLVGFLWVSGATSPTGGEAKGALIPAIVTGVITVAAVVGALLYVPRASSRRRAARAVAAAVALLYADMAGLIKTCTRIYGAGGISSVVTSWQLYVLLVVGATQIILTQYTFAQAPLAASLPVIASLDPLFSVAIGMFVYSERLRENPAAMLGELAFLAVLLFFVGMLSRRAAEDEDEEAGGQVTAVPE